MSPSGAWEAEPACRNFRDGPTSGTSFSCTQGTSGYITRTDDHQTALGLPSRICTVTRRLLKLRHPVRSSWRPCPSWTHPGDFCRQMERRVGLQGKRHPLRSAASPISLSQQHPRRKSRDGIWGPRGSRNLRPHRLYDPFVYWSRNFPISGGTSGSVAVSGHKCLRPFFPHGLWACV